MTTPQKIALTALRRRAAASIAVLAALLMVAPASAADRWLHVKVDELNGAKVNVNLPLHLIEMAFEMIPEDVSGELSKEVRIELNEAGFDVEDLRRLWEEVRNGVDATFLTVEDEGTRIEVRKSGDFFLARTVDGSNTSVDIRFPSKVIDALFSAGPDRLDFAAAVRALADYSAGDMVTVQADDTSVRVWIDDSNEG